MMKVLRVFFIYKQNIRKRNYLQYLTLLSFNKKFLFFFISQIIIKIKTNKIEVDKILLIYNALQINNNSF